MSKAPPRPPSKTILDRLEVTETVCDHLIGAAYMDGFVSLTFGIERIVPGDGRPEAPTYRVVSSRLLLTKDAFSDLLRAVPKIEAALSLANKETAGGEQPN